ncbi:MAG: hypothetical protein K0R62_8047 [Nonomuraea muscovyensis]|nr:hypothetical protein [Nonomuraea muscovyensis]
MNTTTHTTAAALTTEIADQMDALTGFHPALDRVVTALGDLLAADLDAERTQAVIAALSGCADGNLRTLTALIVRQLGNPDANPALTGLDDTRKQTLRRLGAEHAAQVADFELDATASERAAVIDHA